VTITQASAVWELHHSDPRVGARGLYSAGIRIGRDHIASTVNTLVLAYTAALPTLLLFTQSGLAAGSSYGRRGTTPVLELGGMGRTQEERAD
jgi:uncharacterized membrane protein